MAVQVSIDGVDVAERTLVELLQDRELDALIALDGVQRLGKRLDDRRRRQGITRGFQLGTAEQVADGAIQFVQLVVNRVLHPRTMLKGGPTRTCRRITRGACALERGESVWVVALHPPGGHPGQDCVRLPMRLRRSDDMITPRASGKALLVADVRFPTRSNRSPTRSSIPVNESNRRWIARSRQSPRIFTVSRGSGRRIAVSPVVVAFTCPALPERPLWAAAPG